MIKTIKTKKPKVKYVEIDTEEFQETETYQTEDGEIFTNLKEANAHSSDLKLESIRKISYWFPLVSDDWYKAKDENELEFLKNKLAKSYGRRYGEGRLKVGEWFTVSHWDRDDTGNYVDHFVPLSKLKESYQELVELLENKDK